MEDNDKVNINIECDQDFESFNAIFHMLYKNNIYIFKLLFALN